MNVISKHACVVKRSDEDVKLALPADGLEIDKHQTIFRRIVNVTGGKVEVMSVDQIDAVFEE